LGLLFVDSIKCLPGDNQKIAYLLSVMLIILL